MTPIARTASAADMERELKGHIRWLLRHSKQVHSPNLPASACPACKRLKKIRAALATSASERKGDSHG